MALLPLESNPDVMNKFLHLLGVPEKWSVVDVFGLEEDALAWVPRPVLALILLFPCNEKFDKYVEEQREKCGDQIIAPDLFYMKQYLTNACGTFALIHSVANNVDKIELAPDGVLKQILDEAKDMTPEERGKLLTESSGSAAVKNLISAHKKLSIEGQTEVHPDQPVDHHYVALVQKEGHLYELDGSKGFPINHGETSQDTFLDDAAKVCRDYIARDSNEVNFTVLAFAATDN